jgi:hypothetical protein
MAHLLYRFPGANRAETEWRPHYFSLAQEIPTLLCLNRSCRLELLHHTAHSRQLLELFLH